MATPAGNSRRRNRKKVVPKRIGKSTNPKRGGSKPSAAKPAISRTTAAGVSTTAPVSKTPKKAAEKKSESFGAAFKRHRAAGDPVFTFNGKQYHTKTKEEVDRKKKNEKSGY